VTPQENTTVLCVGQLVADIVVRPVARLPDAGRTDLVEELERLLGTQWPAPTLEARGSTFGQP
jgi:sugar/nucleoside kinase (ribokinase family)